MPLGVIPKNENVIKEMVDILAVLHQYVPLLEHEEVQQVPSTISNQDEEITVYKAAVHEILLGGDQLSQARARTALKVKSNGESPKSRLEGFVLTVEDWHTKLTLYEVNN